MSSIQILKSGAIPISSSHPHGASSCSQLIGRSSCFRLCNRSNLVDTVSSVQSSTNLLVSMYKSLKFNVEVFILMLQNTAVTIQSIDLSLNIVVSIKDILIVEAHIVLFFPSNIKLIVNGTQSIFSLEYLSSEVSVTSIFSLGLSSKIRLVSKLTV